MVQTDRRSRTIAARIQGYLTELQRDRPEASRPVEAAALRKAGSLPTDSGGAPATDQEQAALTFLVGRGEVTMAEAQAYLAAKRPDRRFSSGGYGAQGPPSPGPEDEPFPVLRLPPEYDAMALQRALEAVSERAAVAVRSLRVNPPGPQVGTVNGEAIAPGTLPSAAMDLRDVSQQLLQLPGPDEAVPVDLVHSQTRDRYVTSTTAGARGPGRIWEAQGVSPDRNARIGVGPTRYRLIRAGQRFGVMSMRLPPDADMSAALEPGLLIQYGIVVAKIPHFLGRPPSRVLAVESVGDSAVAARVLFANGSNAPLWASGGTNRNLFWNRTQDQHLDAGSYPFAEAFGSDTTLAPSAASLREVLGFSVQLITGRDGGEVFRQLCTRRTLGRHLRMDGHGPALTTPSGIAVESPTPPNVVTWTSPTSYTHRTETYDLSTAGTRVVIGMPFSYSDCADLVPSDTHFSVVVLPLGEKPVSQTVPPLASYGQPDVWDRNGLRLTDSAEERLRTWGLDIIVD